MNNAELYMEFNDECTGGLFVDKNELCKRLRKMKKGTIIEQMDGGYRIYYPIEIVDNQERMLDKVYNLRIDPAERIRFEGSLKKYEELLNDINIIGTGKHSFKVYSKLREEDADTDFFIADIYYSM